MLGGVRGALGAVAFTRTGQVRINTPGPKPPPGPKTWCFSTLSRSWSRVDSEIRDFIYSLKKHRTGSGNFVQALPALLEAWNSTDDDMELHKAMVLPTNMTRDGDIGWSGQVVQPNEWAMTHDGSGLHFTVMYNDPSGIQETTWYALILLWNANSMRAGTFWPNVDIAVNVDATYEAGELTFDTDQIDDSVSPGVWLGLVAVFGNADPSPPQEGMPIVYYTGLINCGGFFFRVTLPPAPP